MNYNTKEITKKCIESIYEKTQDVSFDVWVVDNASQDGSCEMIEECFPCINLIKNDRNLGFGVANNIAIEKSNSKYVFLLNTDTVLINNAIKIMLDFMNSNEDAAACGGSLFNLEGDFVYSFGMLPRLKSYTFNRLGLSFLNKPEKKDRKKSQQTEHIIGADLMLRRSVLNSVGLFDPRFFLYNEELELQFRINQAGFKIYFLPEAKIIHLVGQSSKDKTLRLQYMRKGEYLYFELTQKNLPKFLLKILFKFLDLFGL